MKAQSIKQQLTIALIIGCTFMVTPAWSAASEQGARAPSGAPVTFSDVAADSRFGLSAYERAPSARDAAMRQFRQGSLTNPVPITEIITTPMRSRGIPGVAILDYDRDGDLDLYTTNGPGAANSLFQNQLSQTGEMVFVDVASAAGVEAVAQDSNGVCYGDIDNDGDHDLMVVGHVGGSILYENNGDGTFVDISQQAGVTGGSAGMSCVMGDIDQDGLLDIFIARGYPLDTLRECFADPFSPTIQPNDLLRNLGGNRFADVSNSSGIRELASSGLPPGINTITWSGALVDYDGDGDLDLFTTDDQCNFPGPDFGGFTWGTMQLFTNDGAGNFTNRTIQAGLTLASEWMGTSWGDFNHDGVLDFFTTSFGDWGKQFVGAPIALGDESSRWYLGDGQGGFVDPGLGALGFTPFGWGTAAEDFDRDGDTDIVFHGGLDMVTHAERSNPGVVLVNDGAANFSYDAAALAGSHARRNDAGVAAGDLDGDGWVDLVSVSNFNVPELVPLVPYTIAGIDYGTPFDPAFFAPLMINNGGLWTWTGTELLNGTLAVEINNAESGYRGVAINVFGTVGLILGGANNRDGIGATVLFTPSGKAAAIKPVLGGSSHVSQDSLTQHFGLGRARRGDVEVRWPGGVRNKLYGVRAGERIRMPEIPCSFDTDESFQAYRRCVNQALRELRQGEFISPAEQGRLRSSALRAYHATRRD